MKYSIIITTTRPHLLKEALRSALAQTFGDFEVVVSDNSEAGCREFVESFGDGRVRYARPPQQMQLVAHWDFAFAQARGDWQLLLCDDDAITPNLLSIVDRYIQSAPDVESICWDQGVYSSHSQLGFSGKANQLGLSAFSGQATRYEAAQLLAEMFDAGTGLYRIKRKIPFFPRAACRREILDAVRNRQGQLFHPFCPMTAGAIAVLALSRSTLHIDLPLRILGLTVDSCSGWSVDDTTMETSHAGIKVELAPIKQFRVLPTAQTEAILRTQRAMPDLLGKYQVNYINYFVHCAEFLDECRRYGLDAGPYRRLFDEALAKMPSDVRDGARATIAAGKTAQTRSLYRTARSAVGSLIGGLRGPRLPGQVDAARLGLNDIFDCAVYVGALVDNHVAGRRAAS